MGVVVAKDERAHIPHKYVKLVIDFDLVESYPWGRDAFNCLITSIIKTRGKLKNKTYTLDGFSYAFQIWIMEAIPIIGKLLASKISEEVFECRCINWSGLARVSYADIIQLEGTIKSNDSIFPYISSNGNADIIDSIEYLWPDEVRDDGVDNLKNAIRLDNEFGPNMWESFEDGETIGSQNEPVGEEIENQIFEEDNEAANTISDNIPVLESRRQKTKQPDIGSEQRKRRFLCQRTARVQDGNNEAMKSFIQNMFKSTFSSFEEKIDKRMEKVEFQVLEMHNVLSELTKTAETATTSKTVPQNKCGVSTNSNMAEDDILLSPSCDMYDNLGKQEYLQKTTGLLSQDTVVSGFDPAQTYNDEIQEKKTMVDYSRIKTEDDPLVFVSEESFMRMLEWSNKRGNLKFGPSVIQNELLTRIIEPLKWFTNEDMDAVMYLFRENTSSGHWKFDRVAFMDCMFSVELKVAYEKFLKNRRTYKWDNYMQAYVAGELHSHGKTRKRWATDVDRIYTPVNINNAHWISLCINLVQKTIEVFDCMPNKKDTAKHIEPFKVAIPYIMKTVLPRYIGKDLNMKPFSVIHVSMPCGLNRTKCDCGPYALKFIECHLHGLYISSINDDNIKDVRMKIAVDLWEAATDPIFVDRMLEYEPTRFDSDVSIIDLA